MEIMSAPVPTVKETPAVGDWWRRHRPANNRPTLQISKAVNVAFTEKGWLDRDKKLVKSRELVGRPVVTYDDYCDLLDAIDERLVPLEQMQIPF